MNQGVHLDDNPPFLLEKGTKIVIPPGVTQYFGRPRKPFGTRMLPRMACLQAVSGEKGAPVRFRFAKRAVGRGFRFFLPSELVVGDQVVVIWREPRSAAAVRAEHYPVYRAYFGDEEVAQADPTPESLD